MKQTKVRFLVPLLLAISLVMANVMMAFGENQTPQPQAPAITDLNQEITQSALYLKQTVPINASADFYNSSKLLILLLRSGIDCNSLVDTYLSQVMSTYYSNGNFSFTDTVSDYGYFMIILTLSGKDAANYNGVNIIEKFENSIVNSSQTTINSINPYKLANLYLAVQAYSKKMNNSSACLTTIKNGILSYANENGINYWGNSADNNGFALSGLSSLRSTDIDVNQLVDKALLFSQSLLQSNGTSAGDFQWSTEPNSDSTAASLTLYSTFGYPELAAKTYAGLLTFKNSATPGAFNYTDTTSAPSIYSTIDALYALLSYQANLKSQPSPFDVSDLLNKTQITSPVLNDSSNTIDTADSGTITADSGTNTADSGTNTADSGTSATTAESFIQLNESAQTADLNNLNLYLSLSLSAIVTLLILSSAMRIEKTKFKN